MGSPTLSTSNYLAPDGSSWQLTKSPFDFPNGLLVGPNLDAVIVEGVNALSLNVYGNATIEKSINGSIVFGNGYVSGGTESDGHDAYYTEDPSKGFRVGRGNLWRIWRRTRPVKVFPWVHQAEVCPEEVVRSREKAEREHPVLRE